ncbi:Pr6Pr family membrane protein [Pseudoxanthomonas sp. F37]|uniref:Pr6Pr family membrane protein n=1 Tax=Pseudoxanthomonas TaxID=83618 RepID=UPI001FD3927B|nr:MULTISPECIES: Pr6Pr family membrane protein [Pseudoxanthomonas]UOV06174.1 Pr6Pr family membrane protein [Pseudoxanthomonas mexicana]UOV07754.1 Pr6Pr family membrane protein [Pseudoxanthomonas sp. F37]
MPPAPRAVPSRVCAALVGLLSLAALVLQYVLILQLTRDNVGMMLGTVRFFSYFTILSNIAVMLVACTAAAGWPGCFAQARVRGAVALYIGVTGSIYFVILRHLWQPQGAQWWADTGLHYAVPLVYGAWWLVCTPHGTLRWRDVAGWLLFPLGYVVWVFLRGAWVGEYPYPFIDVRQLGWARVGVNALGVMGIFVALGWVVVGLDRVLGRRRSPL